MFDFSWSEIAVIAVVAMIAIGPKDMPRALKAVTDVIKKARRMAGEFQTHVDEMVREADLGEARDVFRQVRSLDFRNEVRRAVDPDGAIQRTLSDNPMAPRALGRLPDSSAPVSAPTGAAPAFVPPADAPEAVRAPEPPAFVPPGTTRDPGP